MLFSLKCSPRVLYKMEHIRYDKIANFKKPKNFTANLTGDKNSDIMSKLIEKIRG